MKHLIFFAGFVLSFTMTLARPYAFYGSAASLRAIPSPTSYSYGMHSSSLITPTQQQYHTQDDLGQYAYGYSEPLSSKQEVRSLDGITRGSYSYRDAEGKIQTVDYTADANGFHVSATNLPRSQPQSQTQVQAQLPQSFLVPSTSIAAADASDTTIITASDRDQSAAAIAADAGAVETSGLRMASAQSTTRESSSMDPVSSAVELPNTLDNSLGLAAGVVPSPSPSSSLSLLRRRTSIPLTYHQTAPFPPNIYAYSYPLNSRFLSGFYY